MEVITRHRTGFASDVLKLVSGTTIAQAIGVLVTPVLTRLYAPESFGTFAIFSAVTGIVGVVACLRYELAIMLPESDEEASNLLVVSLVSVVLITALTIPAITLGRPLLLRLLNTPRLEPDLWLIPVAVFFGGVTNALTYWTSRTKQFGRLSVTRVISSAGTYAMKLAAGYAGYTSGATLIGASIVGSVLSAGTLARKTWRDSGRLVRSNVRSYVLRRAIARYQRFPLVDIWGALLNTVSWQLPALMLSHFFSATVVGFYSLGWRVLHFPMSLIGSAIGQVFFQRAAEANKQGKLADVMVALMRRLVPIALFPIVSLAFAGQSLFALVFGSGWSQAGVYAAILSPWVFVWFLSHITGVVLLVLEKQDLLLRINLIILVTRALSLSIGGHLANDQLAITLFSASGVLVYGYYVWICAEYSGAHLSTILKQLLPVIVIASVGAAVLFASTTLDLQPITKVGLGIAYCCVGAALTALRETSFRRWLAAMTGIGSQ